MSITRKAKLKCEVVLRSSCRWEVSPDAAPCSLLARDYELDPCEFVDGDDWNRYIINAENHREVEHFSSYVDDYCGEDRERFADYNYFEHEYQIVFEGDDGEFYSAEDFKDPAIDTGDLFSTKKGGV